MLRLAVVECRLWGGLATFCGTSDGRQRRESADLAIDAGVWTIVACTATSSKSMVLLNASIKSAVVSTQGLGGCATVSVLLGFCSSHLCASAEVNLDHFGRNSVAE